MPSRQYRCWCVPYTKATPAYPLPQTRRSNITKCNASAPAGADAFWSVNVCASPTAASFSLDRTSGQRIGGPDRPQAPRQVSRGSCVGARTKRADKHAARSLDCNNDHGRSRPGLNEATVRTPVIALVKTHTGRTKAQIDEIAAAIVGRVAPGCPRPRDCRLVC